jgi:hypothetical protein
VANGVTDQSAGAVTRMLCAAVGHAAGPPNMQSGGKALRQLRALSDYAAEPLDGR